MTLYILSYNNYYNRLVKKERSLSAYLDYEVYTLSATNFVPNDSINAQHIVGAGEYNGLGDYALIVNEDNEIISRWFIIDSVRTRAGQYQLTLRRDVVVDYYNIIIQSPCFIEKATVGPGSPLIYNKEDFQANQIKTSETLLKDKSDCAWLVGYLAPDQNIDNIKVDYTTLPKADIYEGTLADWEWSQYRTSNYDSDEGLKIELNALFIEEGTNSKFLVKTLIGSSYYTIDSAPAVTDTSFYIKFKQGRVQATIKAWADYCATIPFLDYRYTILPNYQGNISTLQGDIIKTTSDNKYYSITVTDQGTWTKDDVIANSSEWWVKLKNKAEEITGVTQTASNILFVYESQGTSKRITLNDISGLSSTFSLTTDRQANANSNSYRTICIPYPDKGTTFRVQGATTVEGEDVGPIVITQEVALAVAKAICTRGVTGSSGKVYDFQLLPYCPIQTQYLWGIDSDGRPMIQLEGDSPLVGHYTTVENKCIIFEVASVSGTFNIDYSIPVRDPKMENQLDMYRLCSPNWASSFDFNAARNGGVQYFNVDYYYKPYTPYIHINPNFGFMYGKDFNDARGLILAGDFSISISNSSWETYELNNKNYQLMFDRQIENLDVQQNVGRWQGILTAGTGTLSGTASGAVLGSMIAPGPGTAIGGIAGGIASALGGIGDVAFSEKLRDEAKDYTKDMYNYNLQNIKALPNTLTKVSAINNNNKIYPVLEYYTCTEIERVAFQQKIRYNGMSIGVIGRIEQYLQREPTYVKAQLIRLEGIEEDFHVVNSIAGELNKGVFI